jgi:hypothetical protein
MGSEMRNISTSILYGMLMLVNRYA